MVGWVLADRWRHLFLNLLSLGMGSVWWNVSGNVAVGGAAVNFMIHAKFPLDVLAASPLALHVKIVGRAGS
jgi:hypothetical protein